MDQKEMDDIPYRIDNNLDTIEHISELLNIEFYTKPLYYGLPSSEKENRAEISIVLLEKLPKLIKTYMTEYKHSKEKQFSVYFYNEVNKIISTYKRKRSRRFYSDITVQNIYLCEIGNKEEMYSSIEYSESLKSEDSKENKEKDIKTFDTKEPIFLEWKKMSRFQRLLFIITIKESYYVDDNDIKNVAEMIHIDEAYLSFHIQRIKEELFNKVDNRDIYEGRRAFSYYLKNRYEIQLLNKIADTIEHQRLQELIKKQEKRWKKHTTSLQNGYHRICPTNARISHLIGISERQVYKYMRHFMDMYNKIK